METIKKTSRKEELKNIAQSFKMGLITKEERKAQRLEINLYFDSIEKQAQSKQSAEISSEKNQIEKKFFNDNLEDFKKEQKFFKTEKTGFKQNFDMFAKFVQKYPNEMPQMNKVLNTIESYYLNGVQTINETIDTRKNNNWSFAKIEKLFMRLLDLDSLFIIKKSNEIKSIISENYTLKCEENKVLSNLLENKSTQILVNKQIEKINQLDLDLIKSLMNWYKTNEPESLKKVNKKTALLLDSFKGENLIKFYGINEDLLKLTEVQTEAQKLNELRSKQIEASTKLIEAEEKLKLTEFRNKQALEKMESLKSKKQSAKLSA